MNLIKAVNGERIEKKKLINFFYIKPLESSEL